MNHTISLSLLNVCPTLPENSWRGKERKKNTMGALPTEFQEYCLQIPSVSQGVVCFHSDGLGCSWTFTVTVFKDLRGSTLFVSLYISLSFSLR